MAPLVLDVVIPATEQVVFATQFLQGALALAIVFVVVVLIEGFILKTTSCDSLRRALLIALAVNVLSALAGVCLVALGAIDRGTITPVGFLVLFALTFALEAVLIRVFEREHTERLSTSFRYSLYMNLASYALIGVLLLVGVLR